MREREERERKRSIPVILQEYFMKINRLKKTKT